MVLKLVIGYVIEVVSGEVASMSFYTNPTVVSGRRMLRSMGLTKPIAKLFSGRQYEGKFSAAMLNAAEEVGATNRIVAHETGLKVEVVTADTLIFERGIAVPDLVKIDVEGFELHVLKGMTRLLMESPPKHIFCEIHFERLDKMGLRKGAEYITDLLNHRGYKVQWFGSSHIHAEPQKSRSSE